MHRLETLLDLLAQCGKALPDELTEVTRLTPFATAFRYEDLPLAAKIDRAGLLPLVRNVRAFVEQQVTAAGP